MVQARSIVAKNYTSNQNFLVGEEASCAGNCEGDSCAHAIWAGDVDKIGPHT